jgi:hypothetical protein
MLWRKGNQIAFLAILQIFRRENKVAITNEYDTLQETKTQDACNSTNQKLTTRIEELLQNCS